MKKYKINDILKLFGKISFKESEKTKQREIKFSGYEVIGNVFENDELLKEDV